MPRSKPFSGKQKKQQLKDKKKKKQEDIEQNFLSPNNRHDRSTNSKRNASVSASRSRSRSTDGFRSEGDGFPRIELLTSGTSGEEYDDSSDKDEESSEENALFEEDQRRKDPRRPDLRTVFDLETKEEIAQRKQEGLLPLDFAKRQRPWAILDDQTFLVDDHGNSQAKAKVNFIPMPKRPQWSYKTPPKVVQQKENEIFKKWLAEIKENYPPERLNYFERNIEVWRQLWRVSERSDAIMLITDARYPLFHFPPALYDFLVNDLKIPIILVLNKIDLVDRGTLSLWDDYFKKNYPDIHAIVKFNSFSRGNPENEDETEKEFKKRRQHGRRRYEDAKGVEDLFDAIRALNIKNKITGDLITLPSESLRLQEEEEREEEEIKRKKKREKKRGHKVTTVGTNEENEDEDEEEKEKRKNAGLITIGTVGHPNVGKSSLINGLVGKKVVSTSRTPGHTKHFQTIRLTPEVQLCDCPGLVFPALDRPKALQILCGLYPLAQVREPFSAIRYMAERVPVETAYRLSLPDDEDVWSPYTICEAYALKKGYVIARTGRPDVHRAGLELLRNCLDGELVISWPPPGTTEKMLFKAKIAAKEKEKEIREMFKRKQKAKMEQEKEATESEQDEEEEEEAEEEEVEEGEAEEGDVEEGEAEIEEGEAEEVEEAEIGETEEPEAGEEVEEAEVEEAEEPEVEESAVTQEANEEVIEEEERETAGARKRKQRNKKSKQNVSTEEDEETVKPKNSERRRGEKVNNSLKSKLSNNVRVPTFALSNAKEKSLKAREYQERLAERQNRITGKRNIEY